MHKWPPATKATNVAMLIAVFVLTAGCESTSSWLKQWSNQNEDPIILGAPEASAYLNDIYKLAGGDPATQAEIFANAKTAAELTPGTSTQLHYALVLATPGHAETSDIEAQSLLRSLLAAPELMTPAEIALATIHLAEVEERLVLKAETGRLRAESARAATDTTEEAAVAQRIAKVEAENRRLKQSLADSEAKLEALSAIERSLREQSGDGEPR
jgi:hypothetical protein